MASLVERDRACLSRRHAASCDGGAGTGPARGTRERHFPTRVSSLAGCQDVPLWRPDCHRVDDAKPLGEADAYHSAGSKWLVADDGLWISTGTCGETSGGST